MLGCRRRIAKPTQKIQKWKMCFENIQTANIFIYFAMIGLMKFGTKTFYSIHTIRGQRQRQRRRQQQRKH